MGIDYYSCEVCRKAFPDVLDYGYCVSCDEVLCASCRDKMGKKYGIVGDHDLEKADIYGSNAPMCCDACYKAETEEITIEELRKKLWSEALTLTVKIEHAKRYEKAELMGRYNALKEIWELVGGDKEAEQ